MISKKLAVKLSHGTILHHKKYTNADGTPVRCRVNGVCKTWVTIPEAYRLPVKYGLAGFFYISVDNATDWVLPRGKRQ